VILEYKCNELSTSICSDLASEFPVYIYWSADKQVLLYSTSVTELFDDKRIPKPLKVSNEGISFLLQSGVVPPPNTGYQNIYILGIGDTAKVATVNGKIEVIFEHKFPFMNTNRLQADEIKPNTDLILQMVAEATINRIDKSKPSFLFHSAGKDSNTIALALAEAGWQDKVTLINYKSKSQVDESEISKKIAKQLGFKHQVLKNVDQLQSSHFPSIKEYYINAPFPCTDTASLGYPLYLHHLPELKQSNIIDGGGNDCYMITPPTQRELRTISLSRLISQLSFMRKFINSENIFNALLRTPAEWYAMAGLSLKDANKIFPNNQSVYPHWSRESNLRKKWDTFYFKTDILTSITAPEVHIRKARNFADSVGSNLILPFANQKLAEYFNKLPETYLFNRKQLKNKIILREILKNRIGLDSDKLGKMGWAYSTRSVILQNWNEIMIEIQCCKLWHQANLLKILNRMRNRMNGKGWGSIASCQYISRIYFISSWYNHNKYLV
jgi:asparagine synthase (glutamine-hydrolysing)